MLSETITGKRHVMLYSGGLDSYIHYMLLTRVYMYRVTPLYIDYNGKYSNKEKLIAQKLVPETVIINPIDLSQYEDENHTIKNRNMLLITLASTHFPEIKSFIVGGIAGTGNLVKRTDADIAALESYAKSLSRANNSDPFYIWSAFPKKDKSETVAEYLKYLTSLQFKVSTLIQTTSCYDKDELWCGRCLGCLERFIALKDNGIIDPKMPVFINTSLQKEYIDAIISDERKEHIAELLGV